MNKPNKSLFYIHLSVFLFGFSALFARLVFQPAIVITFGRVFFSSIFLLLITYFYKTNLKLDSKKDYFLIIFAGIILAIHWFCYIQSIQLSSVAIGTITFSTFPVFSSFFEPIFFKEKFRARTIFFAIIMIFGIVIIAHPANTELTNRTAGIVVGLISGFTFSVLSLLNRRFSAKYKPETIVLYEQLTAALFLLPFMLIIRPSVAARDLILLAILGIVFTAFAHGLFIKGLRYTKVSTAGVITGLEAVYSILLATILLREIPVINELIGGLIVITLAIYMTFYKSYAELAKDHNV